MKTYNFILDFLPTLKIFIRDELNIIEKVETDNMFEKIINHTVPHLKLVKIDKHLIQIDGPHSKAWIVHIYGQNNSINLEITKGKSVYLQEQLGKLEKCNDIVWDITWFICNFVKVIIAKELYLNDFYYAHGGVCIINNKTVFIGGSPLQGKTQVLLYLALKYRDRVKIIGDENSIFDDELNIKASSKVIAVRMSYFRYLKEKKLIPSNVLYKRAFWLDELIGIPTYVSEQNIKSKLNLIIFPKICTEMNQVHIYPLSTRYVTSYFHRTLFELIYGIKGPYLKGKPYPLQINSLTNISEHYLKFLQKITGLPSYLIEGGIERASEKIVEICSEEEER